MHTRIEFNMYRPSRNTLLFSSMNKGIHQSERVNLRLQVIVEHRLEGRHLRIHNHNVLRDAVTSQGDALVSHSHSQIVNTMLLKCLGHLDSTSTIGVSLHHTHELGLWFQERTIIVQIVNNGIKVYLEDGLVYFLF